MGAPMSDWRMSYAEVGGTAVPLPNRPLSVPKSHAALVIAMNMLEAMACNQAHEDEQMHRQITWQARLKLTHSGREGVQDKIAAEMRERDSKVAAAQAATKSFTSAQSLEASRVVGWQCGAVFQTLLTPHWQLTYLKSC